MADTIETLTVSGTDLEFVYESVYTSAQSTFSMYPHVGQGPAKLADQVDMARDALGFTNPNLHRRVDPQDPPKAEDPRNQEVAPRDYKLTIQNVHSYRTTQINVHDEESIYNETP